MSNFAQNIKYMTAKKTNLGYKITIILLSAIILFLVYDKISTNVITSYSIHYTKLYDQTPRKGNKNIFWIYGVLILGIVLLQFVKFKSYNFV